MTQRQSIAYSGSLSQLHYFLSLLASDVEKVMLKERQGLRVFKSVLVFLENKMVSMEVGGRVLFNP